LLYRKKILLYRKKKGYNQKELADRLGIGATTVSGWERGAYTPDIDTLFVICRLLGVTLNDMFGIDEFSDANALTVTGIERDIVLAYRKADGIGKAMVLRALGIEEVIAMINYEGADIELEAIDAEWD
jgi:transcriptional regulator with XRE-family HTH domain